MTGLSLKPDLHKSDGGIISYLNLYKIYTKA